MKVRVKFTESVVGDGFVDVDEAEYTEWLEGEEPSDRRLREFLDSGRITWDDGLYGGRYVYRDERTLLEVIPVSSLLPEGPMGPGLTDEAGGAP